MTIRTALHTASERLQDVSTTPLLDAEILLAFVFKKSREYVLAHYGDELTNDIADQWWAVLEKRLDAVPVAYILGYKEFYGRRFEVNQHVLIPRPETEMVIDLVKEYVDRAAPRRMIDIGTGSGCIGITLALEFISSTVVVTDLSPQALRVARLNAKALGASVEDRCGNLYGVCTPREQHLFDVIVSNPPYVPAARLRSKDIYARALIHEPAQALTPEAVGVPGLQLSMNVPSEAEEGLLPIPSHGVIVKQLIEDAPQWLAPHGLLVIEIGEDMGAWVLERARMTFPDAMRCEVKKDFAGLDRFLVVQVQ